VLFIEPSFNGIRSTSVYSSSGRAASAEEAATRTSDVRWIR
jgi:hypothetical protein